MILLDLFCGAGGASMGYHLAGFDVVGVDIKAQPHYPFRFYRYDALDFCELYGKEFDIIHASPPCQCYSVTRGLSNGNHKAMIPEVREALIKTGKHYVIENVPGAPLVNPILLCGTMFGLSVIRHRLFECNPNIWFSPATCKHDGKASGNRNAKGTKKTLDNFRFITVVGNDYIASDGRKAMQIDWMTKRELSQAIPPQYTKWIGHQIITLIEEHKHGSNPTEA